MLVDLLAEIGVDLGAPARADQAREQSSNAHPGIGCRVVGFLDDNSSKRSMRIHGVRVLGGRADLASVARKHGIDEVLLALPEDSGDQLTVDLGRFTRG